MEILNGMRCIAALAGLLAGAAAFAGVPGAVFEHGDIHADTPDGPIEVRSGLLQLELAPGVIASASGGTTLQVARARAAQGTIDVRVLQGSLRIVRLGTNRLAIVGPGRYVINTTKGLGIGPKDALGSSDDALRHLYVDYRPGFQLVDSIMLRQNEALQVDTRSFVRGIFGIFGR